jgi:16S rRNA (cytosine967-C5)-methyltransferase
LLHNPRQLAFLALQSVQRGAFADVALDKALNKWQGDERDRRLITELVYGSIRRQRTLDTLITQFAKRTSAQQPTDLRLILQLGLYQLRYLSHIPASAAVNTTVELAKQNGFAGLAGFVNGLMRQYGRAAEKGDPLHLPDAPVERLAIQQSYPDWIVQGWVDQWGEDETERLCEWLNRPPHIDLRINPLKTEIAQVEAAMQAQGILVQRLPLLPQALRLVENVGAIWKLPGFDEGWWTVQDSSSQLVSHVLDPQAGEVIIDACAAPGGKTTHMTELMGDRGTIWACDRNPTRLKKLQQNVERLQLASVQICTEDSRSVSQFTEQADRVLLDAPCSGLGTLHRHADARWRQSPERVQELAHLQQELIEQAMTWVKPGGILVYSTCTLHPLENEAIAQGFLERHPNWHLDPPDPDRFAPLITAQGWLKVVPHHQDMDGFFIARFRRNS